MAEGLRDLVGTGSARELQEKLESWQQDYEVNSSGENLNRCCEILELNTAIQKQLFTILNETSREDGNSEGAETIKNRLLPQLGTCYYCSTSGKTFENNLTVTQDSVGSEMQLKELDTTPETCPLKDLEEKLTSTRLQINQMEQDLSTSRAEEEDALKKLERLNDYEQQIQMLRDEITILDAQKSVLQSRLARSRSPYRRSGARSQRSLRPKSWSPGRARHINASRRACLVARFGFIYAQERFDAETLLRTYISDMEMVQRIIYTAAVESFYAAKMAYWKFKIHVKEALSLGHSGPESLEDAVLDYIVCHKDEYDVYASVKEVIRSMNINPKISFPPEIDFIVLSTLIQELCCLAFSMQTLVPPLDVAFGIDGELFNESKYYRSPDSDFTAAFVAYHVWPALVEDGVVIVKGEVVTKRVSLCFRRSKIRSRSCSCSTRRLLSSHSFRSRSFSPLRSRKSLSSSMLLH
ncbi:mitochondria-eating protein isoform X1 [Myiozetetes cayanensis]|uniref:mitochondria-eating protein isoform X1 n=1 Tax=Myiozetetes cayanensis TaxID=478635 RepID=UPI00215F7680|nr:mitochondria-eating protein isoform X1 [Myiozetetes cayanensis]